MLPLRFGTVMATRDAVAGELLAVYQEAFAAALKQAEGRAQIPEAARLAEQIRGKDPNATRHGRIRLGSVISNAIMAKRNADTRALAEIMAPHCVATVVREPTHELDAVHLALLAEITRQADLEQVLSDLASNWEGRVEMRLLGPQAPYDFTPNPLPPR